MSDALTGAMTWAMLLRSFRDVTGSTGAAEEQFAHLTQGYRDVLNRVECPEVYVGELKVSIAADPVTVTDFLDYYDLSSQNLHAIYSVLSLTDERPLYEEPGGMRGRDRFLEQDGAGSRMVATEGVPRYYVRYEDKLYIRPRPSVATEIVIRYRLQAPAITSADVNASPATPDQFDFAIVQFAAHNYFLLHPEADIPPRDGMPPPSDRAYGSAMKLITEPLSVVAEEEKGMIHTARLAGYRVTPRSGRW